MENYHVNRPENAAAGNHLQDALRKEAGFRQGDEITTPSRYRRHESYRGSRQSNARRKTGDRFDESGHK